MNKNTTIVSFKDLIFCAPIQSFLGIWLCFVRHFPRVLEGKTRAVGEEVNSLQHVCDIFDISPSKCLQASPTSALCYSQSPPCASAHLKNEQSLHDSREWRVLPRAIKYFFIFVVN